MLGLTGLAGHLFAHQFPGQWSMLGPAEWYRNCLAVTGACLALRRETFEQVGGFDEAFQLCGSDVDLCLKVHHSGLRNLVNPFARLIHLESATRSDNAIPFNDYRVSYQHYLPHLKAGDPYFNPNLSLWQTSPGLRQPHEKNALEFVENLLKTHPEMDKGQEN
jgi:GT2 family glycosyltransferase